MKKRFHFDANAVNARQANSDLNRLEDLERSGAVWIDYPRPAYDEASAGCEFRAEKAAEYVWMELSGQPEFEEQKRAAIARIVFPNGVKTIQQKNDVEILLTAFMCGAILVTSDGASNTQPRGILGSKADLAEIGVRVMSPREALEEALRDAQEDD
jgi:hypothetical protein